MSSRRTYILDTSVLLADPSALFAFEEHEVVLPLVVVQELEAKRNDPNLGYTARASLRTLEGLRTSGGDLAKGVPVNEQGGMIRIEVNHVDRSGLPDSLRKEGGHDARILAVAMGLAAEGDEVILVSKDMPMRIMASTVCRIPAQEYRNEQAPTTGWMGLETRGVSSELTDALYVHKMVGRDHPLVRELLEDIPVNSGLVLTAAGSSALARVDASRNLRLVNGDAHAFGVHGRSAEQRIALAHLLDPDIGIVSLGGPGGTGKSLLALAAALELVLERRTQKRIVVFRPLYAVGGQELGYLPGTENEKMSPWAAAVFDALRAFTTENVIDEVIDRQLLEVLPLTHIRGRTFTDSVIVLDEAQQLERMVLLTALSRTGDNTRVFITHDVAQRDNLRVGRHDGISAVVEKLKGDPLFAHVTLTKSERSPVAALVTRLLDQIDP